MRIGSGTCNMKAAASAIVQLGRDWSIIDVFGVVRPVAPDFGFPTHHSSCGRRHGKWDSKAIRAGSRNGEPQLDRGQSNPNDLPYPEQGLVLTPFLTVRDVARPRDFYADIFGGRVVLKENPAIVKAPTAGSS